MSNKDLTKADIRTKFITPAITEPHGIKWDRMPQVREEVTFINGRMIDRAKTVKRSAKMTANLQFVP